eukprot:5404624-Pyramimonas_sp.AAC.1
MDPFVVCCCAIVKLPMDFVLRMVVASQLMLIKKRVIPEEYIKVVLWPGAAYKQAKLTFECEVGMRTKNCKKTPRWLPNWPTLISSNDPRKVDEAMNAEFKDRKVQIVVRTKKPNWVPTKTPNTTSD